MANERDRKHPQPDGLTPEELQAETAEALPERAVMSTVSLTNLDAAAGTVEAVSDGFSETTAGAADAATAPTERVPQDTAMAAEPEETAPEATATPDEATATPDEATATPDEATATPDE